MKKNYWDKLKGVSLETNKPRDNESNVLLSFGFGGEDQYHILIANDTARSDLAIKLHNLADEILQVETEEDKE